MNQITFHIENNMYRAGIVIWARFENNGKEFNLQPDVSGHTKAVEVTREPNPELVPLLTLDRSMADGFIRAIVNHANENNIKAPDHNLIEGKLKATQEHLADMQKAFNTLLSQIENI